MVKAGAVSFELDADRDRAGANDVAGSSTCPGLSRRVRTPTSMTTVSL
jgi:hypothetical protein